APVWITAAVFALLTVFLTRTRDGIRLMAVGGNPEAVRRSGIHAARYKVLGFVISGFCAALGGLVTAALVTEANPAANPGIIFNALTAVALAGVALSGGRGSLPRVLVGALILGTISNGLTIKGIQPYWATTLTGALLLASPALELRDIDMHYGYVRALDGIDVAVRQGEVLGLLGDNGAGKSTLLKVMS